MCMGDGAAMVSWWRWRPEHRSSYCPIAPLISATMFFVGLLPGHASCWLLLLTAVVKKLEVLLSSIGVQWSFQWTLLHFGPTGILNPLEAWLQLPFGLHPGGRPSPQLQGELFLLKAIQEMLDTFHANECHERLWVAKYWPSLCLNRQRVCSRASSFWGFSSQNPEQNRGLKLLFCFWCFLQSTCLNFRTVSMHTSHQLLPLSPSISSSHNPPRGRDGYFLHFLSIAVLPV